MAKSKKASSKKSVKKGSKKPAAKKASKKATFPVDGPPPPLELDGGKALFRYEFDKHSVIAEKILNETGGKLPNGCSVRKIDRDYYFLDSTDRKHRNDNDQPAIISPNYVERWLDGLPHRNGGPSIIYSDGMMLFHLHGVKVTREIAMATDSDFTIEMFAKEPNAEVRREIVRKFGIERILQKGIAEMIDKDGDYELYLIDLGEDVGKWPYLKMLNPSEKVWHVEPVGEETRTVADALTFRNQSALRPGILT